MKQTRMKQKRRKASWERLPEKALLDEMFVTQKASNEINFKAAEREIGGWMHGRCFIVNARSVILFLNSIKVVNEI